MTKPTEKTEWATQGDGSGGASNALRTATDASRWNFGWQSIPDNEPTDEGEAPNLNQQNYWQYAVHKWIEYFTNVGPAYFIAADNSSAEAKEIADAVCDGTDDDVEIAAGITAAASLPHKRVVLLEGDYTFGTAVTINDDDLILEGQGNVRIYSDANGFANGLFSLLGDRCKLLNITFAGDGSFQPEDGVRVGAVGVEVRGLYFETGSIEKQSAAGDSNSAILVINGATNCLIEAEFETESVITLDATGIASLVDITNVSAVENTINLKIADRALKGGGANVYYNNVTPVSYAGQVRADINTNWVDIQPDVPFVGTEPANYAIDKYKYRFEGGNILLDFMVSWNGAAPANVAQLNIYPTLAADIPTNNFIGGASMNLGTMAHRDIAAGGKFNQFDGYSWFFESGIGLRLTGGGAAPINWNGIGNNSAISPATYAFISMHK